MNKELNELAPCPCCGAKVISEPDGYEICDVCGWEDDPVQSADPNYAGGANKESLNEARKKWVSRSQRPQT